MAFRYLRFRLGTPDDPDDNRAALAHYEPSVATEADPDRTVDVPVTDLFEALLTYEPGAPERKRWLVQVQHNSPVVGRLTFAAFGENENFRAAWLLRHLAGLLAKGDLEVREIWTQHPDAPDSFALRYLINGRPASMYVPEPKDEPEPAPAEASADA